MKYLTLSLCLFACISDLFGGSTFMRISQNQVWNPIGNPFVEYIGKALPINEKRQILKRTMTMGASKEAISFIEEQKGEPGYIASIDKLQGATGYFIAKIVYPFVANKTDYWILFDGNILAKLSDFSIESIEKSDLDKFRHSVSKISQQFEICYEYPRGFTVIIDDDDAMNGIGVEYLVKDKTSLKYIGYINITIIIKNNMSTFFKYDGFVAIK